MISDDQIYDLLEPILLGTSIDLAMAMNEAGLGGFGLQPIEEILEARNLAPCARCGTWTLEGEYCETCAEEVET